MPSGTYGDWYDPTSDQSFAQQAKAYKANVRAGPQRLEDILGKYFTPEIGGARKRRGQIEGAFLPTLDPRNAERYVTEGAERVAADFLRPGGVATEAIRRARGQSIGSGFGTEGGDLSRQEANIVSEGLRSSVGSFIGQSLPSLYEGAAGRAAGAYGLTQEQVLRLIESMFTGQAGAESLRLAWEG